MSSGKQKCAVLRRLRRQVPLAQWLESDGPMSHRSRVQSPQGTCAHSKQEFGRLQSAEEDSSLFVRFRPSCCGSVTFNVCFKGARPTMWSQRQMSCCSDRFGVSSYEWQKHQCSNGRIHRCHDPGAILFQGACCVLPVLCAVVKLRVPTFQAAIAQLVARRSHNPKVVSSILTRRTL